MQGLTRMPPKKKILCCEHIKFRHVIVKCDQFINSRSFPTHLRRRLCVLVIIVVCAKNFRLKICRAQSLLEQFDSSLNPKGPYFDPDPRTRTVFSFCIVSYQISIYFFLGRTGILYMVGEQTTRLC